MRITMAFGSILHTFEYVSLTGDCNLQANFKNSSLSRLSLRILGVPHIGLRLRSAKILKNIPSYAIKMLDAGFGTGIYSYTLCSKIKTIDAIDSDVKKVDYANRVNYFKNINFQAMDLTKLRFEDSSFDLIICSQVLEKIKEGEIAFSELARVLKKGGTLLLTVPFDSKKRRSIYKDYDDVRSGYTEEEMQDLCSKYGLTLLKSEGYSHYLAERAATAQYNILNYKILNAISFYFIFAFAQLCESIPWRGSPNDIFFKITKK